MPGPSSSRATFDAPSHSGCVAASLLAFVCLASTCENQDYLWPAALTLTEAPPFEPVAVDLVQPYRGLNSVDFSVTNTGDEPASYALFVAVYCDLEECSHKSTSRIIGPVDPGLSSSGRLYESELGLGELLHIELQCYAEEASADSVCSGRLDYVVILRQTDCRGDNDCGSDEYCDQDLGYCRLSGDVGEGCQVGVGPVAAPIASAAALALIAIGLSRRRRASTRR